MNTVRANQFKQGQTPRRIVASLRQGRNKGVTAKELSKRLTFWNSSRDLNTTRRSINRMMLQGKMERGGVRKCKITGREVYTYHLTETESINLL